jgi:large subunit ribosomal protein L9
VRWAFLVARQAGVPAAPSGFHPRFSHMATTEVILIEKIENLGAEADVVKVKRGYARNFLVPNRKALEVTPATLKRLNMLKAKRAEREARELNEAEELGRRIQKLRITMELETGETGKAFGSITAADIAERLKKELGGKGEVDRHRIHLEKPIKESGDQDVPIKLHADVTAKLTVHVKAKGAEKPAPETAAEENEPKEKGFKAKPKARHAK